MNDENIKVAFLWKKNSFMTGMFKKKKYIAGPKIGVPSFIPHPNFYHSLALHQNNAKKSIIFLEW